MTQNTSHAVMAQRAEPHDSLDFFPTPAWATRALCDWLLTKDPHLRTRTVWEPACGQGHMVLPLGEYFASVYPSDVHAYGCGEHVEDFLFPNAANGTRFDWIITNPPFRLGLEFALTGIERARHGVALLVRTAFLEGGDRFKRLFGPHPPAAILQFCERVPMVKGRYDPNASTATSYCWIVWQHRHGGAPAFVWIPPCRKRFERPSDYQREAAE